MSEIAHKFLSSENHAVAYLEWSALRRFVFNGDHLEILRSFPELSTRMPLWGISFNAASSEIKHVNDRLSSGKIKSLEDFYAEVQSLLKPKPKGKAFKEIKKHTYQAEYQKERLGDDYIDCKPLVSAGKAAALELINHRADEAQVTAKAREIEEQHKDLIKLSEGQFNTLVHEVILAQMNKLMHPDNVEAKILGMDNKDVWYMWGKIKRSTAVGDTFDWGTAKAAEQCSISKSKVPKIMKSLISVGAITMIQKGKAGASSQRATIYKRLV